MGLNSTAHRRYLKSTIAFILVCATGAIGCSPRLERRFLHHIEYLASDALEGRGVGTPGIESAAEYIAAQFAAVGLEPAGDEGTFFQSFEVTLHRKLDGANRLAFEGDGAECRMGQEFTVYNFSSTEAFTGDVVFCGYGIVATERQHDDFAHVDLNHKVAIIFRGEPPSWSDGEGNTTHHAWLRNKVYNAKDRGAVAVLFVNQTAEGEKDELPEFQAEGADEYGIPALHVSRAFVDQRLADKGLDCLATLQQRLDAGDFASAAWPGVRVTGQARFEKSAATTRNVLGVIRGAGDKVDEYVVIGAHYDHLGKVKPAMRKFKAGKIVADSTEPEIHNGADDNASGVSGLIEIARMFAMRPPPSRSILFIAFTAEESGLLGSKYYVEHAAMPVSRMAAMLNMDMIGRMAPGRGTVEVFGEDCGTGFSDVLRPAAQSVGLAIAPSPDMGGRSDHASFIRKQVPSMHFFTGLHADYHKPSDDSDKINAEDGARVVRLVYGVARDLAARDEKPEFRQEAPRSPAVPDGTPSYRVVMGLAPGYGDDGRPGMAVEAVNPEGPADLAGMKAGDRIVRINDKKIANVYDYMAATRGNKAGDTVDVVVSRTGTEIPLRVTLSAAR